MVRRGILAVGNWIVDRIKVIDRWPREGELCNILEEKRAAGGGPCNVLFDLAALQTDLPLHAAGVLGSDNDGDWLFHEISRRGIGTDAVSRHPELPTATTDVMAANGRRTFFHRAGANAALTPEKLLTPPTPPVQFFYLGYPMLLAGLDAPDSVYGTGAARVLAAMRERGCRTVIDLVSGAPEKFQTVVPPALPHTDILVLNEIEAGHLSGFPLRRKDGTLLTERLPEALRHCFRLGVRELTVLHYPEGCCAATADGRIACRQSFPVAAAEIVDSTGAGDAFCAGFLFGLHEGLGPADLLDYAAAEARFNLLASGASAGAPSRSALAAFLQATRYCSEGE